MRSPQGARWTGRHTKDSVHEPTLFYHNAEKELQAQDELGNLLIVSLLFYMQKNGYLKGVRL